MKYREAVITSRIRRIAGWVLALAAAASTAISLMRLIYYGIDEGTRIANASFFKHHVYLVYKNTRFLDWFWENCPIPDLVNVKHLDNVIFLAIYIAIFAGLALRATGKEIRRELAEIERFTDTHLVDNPIEMQEVIDQQLIARSVTIAAPSIFSQVIPLYVLPVVVTIAGGLLLKLLGFF